MNYEAAKTARLMGATDAVMEELDRQDRQEPNLLLDERKPASRALLLSC
jgi:hypothetical protein